MGGVAAWREMEGAAVEGQDNCWVGICREEFAEDRPVAQKCTLNNFNGL